jgi:hypothetical protein
MASPIVTLSSTDSPAIFGFFPMNGPVSGGSLITLKGRYVSFYSSQAVEIAETFCRLNVLILFDIIH